MSRITLSMKYTDLSGAPYSGQVVFQPTSTLQDVADGASVGLTGVTVVLNGSGAGSVSLLHTDDPLVTPGSPALATWTYRVTEQLVDPTGLPEFHQPYYVDLPVSLGGAANLWQIPHFGNRPGLGLFLYGAQ